jgi:predicted metalloprotease with PDZ domain
VGYPDSARVNVGENDFVNENAYNAFLVAATQALTKAWYGKAARPDSMQPFDYSREAYSRILWFTDGVAAYTADMLLLRAGILTSPEYFPRLSAEIDALQHQSGRLVTSLEEASLNAWTRGENSVNATIPYTLKGKIAGLLLDADIRGRSGGTKTLDDVLRRLLAGAASRRGGMTEATLEEEIRGATGVNVSEFFAAVVRGKNEIDYNRYLEALGVKVSEQKAPATIYFGIEFDRIEANQARVRRVLPSSPAEAAKLDAGDVVIAMDSDRVTFDNLTSRIHSKPLGKSVALTVMRGDRLLTLSIVPGLTQTESWTIEENLQATPEQVRLREAWVAPTRAGK